MTVFPWVNRSPTYRIASAASVSGEFRSMTGVSLPASRSSCSTTRSAPRGLDKNDREPLADERGHQDRSEGAPGPHEPPTTRSPDQHQRPFGGEGTPQICQGAVPGHLQDQVVVLPSLGEVLLGVVDHLVGA